MKRIFIILTLALAVVGCARESWPDNPVIKSKIGSLIMTVRGEDYTAIPVLNEKKELTDTMLLSVKLPSNQATVKTIKFSEPTGTADIKEGDVVDFVNDMFTFHYSDSYGSKDFVVVMSYNPPPFYYLVKSSDRDDQRVRYYLDVNVNPHVASGNYDHNFEGYVDLTATNWDNICLVNSDQTAYYDVAGGFAAKQSYGTLTLVENTPQGDGHYPCNGPWGEWTTDGGNEKIVSPGYWRVSFNSETLDLTMLETQWAVTGSAVSETTAMIFYPEDKVWKLTCTLKAGNVKFVTIPVTATDPVLEYGADPSSTGSVKEGGNAINVEAGEYEIILDLHEAANYVYSIAAPAAKVQANFIVKAGADVIFADGHKDNLNIASVTVKDETEKSTALELESVEVAKDGKSITATAEVVENGSYLFRGYIAPGINDKGQLRILGAQSPETSSIDSKADVLLAEDCTTTSAKDVQMNFTRKVAVADLKLEGITAGELVTSIEITSDKVLAGYYDPAEDSYSGDEQTITLNYEKVAVSGVFDAFFVAAPGEDEHIALKVNTDKSEYTGETSGNLKLTAGAVTTSTITLKKSGASSYPFMYMTKTSDRFVDGKKFTIDPEKSQKIWSENMDANYEGYVDLTGTNWDNIGFVKSDLSGYFDSNSGFGSNQSYGTLTLTEEPKPDGDQFVCNGPWGDWLTTAGNPKIVSPGYWKINFNSSTKELVVLETQWAISGSAVTETTAMVFDNEERVWKLHAKLAAGSFKFVTIPVNTTDPTVEYGVVSSSPVKLGTGGSAITVDAGEYDIILNLHAAPNYTYTMEKSASIDPYLYLTKTSDRFVDNKKYTVDPAQSQKIMAIGNGAKYEGYVDLTGTNWDNIGLVKSDLSGHFDSASGFAGSQSYGTLTMKERTPEGVQFPCDGPWGDWMTTAGNPKIVSPGYWKINFDMETKELVMLETQWAIGGSAVSEVTAMTYDSASKKWTLNCELSAGTFKFVTIPVNATDPTVEYGETSASKVGADGSEISVKAGEYEIVLDLTAATGYSYSIKSTTPEVSFMYFIKTSDRFVDNLKYTIDPEKSQKVYSTDATNFEGYIDLTGTNWDNIGIVKGDQSGYFDSTSGFAGSQSYGTLTMNEKGKPEGVQFPCDGPWGDWTTTAGNPKIVSPGYWKVNFNISTKELVMLETQWAVKGTAISDVTAMTYDTATKVWKLSCTLSNGNISFTTIAVNASDPVVEYGKGSAGVLAAGGSAIDVEAGDYDIVLDFSKGVKYTYTITKK